VKTIIKKLLRALGYEVRGTRLTPRQLLQPKLQRPLEFDDVICRRMFESGEEFNFIQIGAFDGLVQDPLRKYIARCRWRGVMVEPQPGPAGRLHELYKDNDRIVVLQAAVDRQAGVRSFFTVDSPAAPMWAGALASFKKDVVLRHADDIPGLERMIKEVNVDCITFDSVFAHLPEGNLDLLQIDTEGADAFILSLFPFERIKPAIVSWEVRHLSFREREECLALLASYGYRFALSGSQDMLAVRAPEHLRA
jgi:FkbM family methyltransferase